jgi:type II secretory ATPase GspE/PulE/Tfp pilus assembly ATPase PilB-like protein
VQLDISQLGMPKDIFNGIQDIIRRPNGIFSSSPARPAPARPPRSTVACAIINTVDLKLLTVEDPVEYRDRGASCRFR